MSQSPPFRALFLLLPLLHLADFAFLDYTAITALVWAATPPASECYTHRLTSGGNDPLIWTVPPSERVFKDSPIPTAEATPIKVYAAQNEFEPFLVIVNPQTDLTLNIEIDAFGQGITADLFQVDYVPIATPSDELGRTGAYPDPLWPLPQNASVTLPAKENTAFWINLHIPAGVSAGDYSAIVHIGKTPVPVKLHVFKFAVPDTLHVKSQMNVSHQAFLEKYGVEGTSEDYWTYVFKIKEFFIDHRLTPKSPLWAGGLTSRGAPFIDYDCTTGMFSDPHGIWGFEIPARRFLDGEEFHDGTGFPSFMAMTFVNNDASDDQRPNTFCGLTRSAADWMGTPDSSYNQAWFAYVRNLTDYLATFGYLDKAYYYFANEPQDTADYDAVAWYAAELKKHAPDLKLMVSEEPRPEIFAHPEYPEAKIDIWLPVLNNYNPEISHQRKQNFGEATWIYFLHGTRPPFFNPITLDHPGIESKLTGWFLWKYRIEGIAYYSLNNWSQNPWTDPMVSHHNGDLFMLYPPSKSNTAIPYGANDHRFVPSIRFELMRDSLEDFEYLYLLNQGNLPQVGVENSADHQADKVISGLTSYVRDSEFLYNLRRLIGLTIGGELAAVPDLTPPSSHPRAQGAPSDYYLNFQDPAGAPKEEPLIVDGDTYMKIGWTAYDADLGYGWFGNMDHVAYQYLSQGTNELQKSVLYDDWGRQHTFEFDLPNGTYEVTLSLGWAGKRYAHNKVDIEGIPVVDDEATDPYLIKTQEVKVTDAKLTLEMGIFDEYTMLNSLIIRAKEGLPVSDPQPSLATPELRKTLKDGLIVIDWDFLADARDYTFILAPVDHIDQVQQVAVGNIQSFSLPPWEAPAFYLAVAASDGTRMSAFSNVVQVP